MVRRKRRIVAINLMSSPGAGKTTLLERTLEKVGQELGVGVVVGDQETALDAERLLRYGCPVRQIETKELCHLEAASVGELLQEVVRPQTKLLFIENVGNLICPAAFNLGEHKKVAMLSVVEGEDKPLKYPAMFARADLVILSKSDLATLVDFNEQKAVDNIRRVAPQATLLKVSAKTGEGMDSWFDYLKEMQKCA